MSGTCPSCHEPTEFYRIPFTERDFDRLMSGGPGMLASDDVKQDDIEARFGKPTVRMPWKDPVIRHDYIWIFASSQGKSRYLLKHEVPTAFGRKAGFGEHWGLSSTGPSLGKFFRWLGIPRWRKK